MNNGYKMSLPAAILMNLNFMLGTGVFVNTVVLAKFVGFMGFLCYVVVGLMLSPLIFTFSDLLKIHPGGSLYTFAEKEISRFAGFITTWIYAIGKTGSASLMIHVFCSFLQQIFVDLRCVPTLGLDFFVLAIFAMLNLLKMQLGNQIQVVFVIMKLIPILFVLGAGLIFFEPINISYESIEFTGLLSGIPLVIFSLAGFELTCAVSSHIKNPEKNASRAILIAFGIVLFFVIAYQFLFFVMCGSDLMHLGSYVDMFPALLNKIIHDGLSRGKLLTVLNLALALSSLGSAYGVLYGNTWNFYRLAQNKHVYFANYFERLNKNGIPFLSLFLKSSLIVLFLLITKGNQIPLQQVSAMGSLFAYTMSAFALFRYRLTHRRVARILPVVALLSCTVLFVLAIEGLMVGNITGLLMFLTCAVFGIIMFFATKKRVAF
ncbi:MAG: APC family amino acid-polyamine-organocation transporter [candidate division TM6 bacterium GW2011_GWF2_32_72]|nr:MAG: APC family amino acid-polyamine-organocation transporter [candidate division TM6 bacterium GW2011_GWF2_32_72]